jgi:hypothetical protein
MKVLLNFRLYLTGEIINSKKFIRKKIAAEIAQNKS